jgi:penicillin-binding protein 1A
MGTANTDTSRNDQQQQEEKRRQERRQQEQNPNEERRDQPRRQNMEMSPGRHDENPDSPPQKDNTSRNETPGNWQGEDFQRGTGRAQTGEGQTPRQQHDPSDRREQKGQGGGSHSNPPSGKEVGPGGKEGGFGSTGSQKKSAGA